MGNKTNVRLEGIERSGNVFFTYCLRMSLVNTLISTRDHEIGLIKNYRGDEPFVVPVRDALESICSSKIYRDYVFNNNLYGDNNKESGKIELIIYRFQEYQKALLDNPKFFIAPFHEFTKDHNSVINVLVNQYPDLEIAKYCTKEEIFEEILIKNADTGIFKNPVSHPEIGHLPREISQEKQNIMNILLSKHAEKIKKIQDNINLLYQRYYNLVP